MTKDELIECLLNQGFSCNGNEYRKDILVVSRNDTERRFEVFYDVGEKIPVYWYDDLIKDYKPGVLEHFFTGLYDAIKTFDDIDT